MDGTITLLALMFEKAFQIKIKIGWLSRDKSFFFFKEKQLDTVGQALKTILLYNWPCYYLMAIKPQS